MDLLPNRVKVIPLRCNRCNNINLVHLTVQELPARVLQIRRMEISRRLTRLQLCLQVIGLVIVARGGIDATFVQQEGHRAWIENSSVLLATAVLGRYGLGVYCLGLLQEVWDLGWG